MSPELSRLHSLLNNEAIIPVTAYRRNKVIYELICYVNCLIGCVLSDRRDLMPAFVNRCQEFMNSHALTEYEGYYSAVRSYLSEVEREFDLRNNGANI